MGAIKAAILGASGYTGSELLRILLRHPEVEVNHVTAERHAGKPVSDVLPQLRGICTLELLKLDPDTVPADTDVVFAALPHGTSAGVVRTLAKDRGMKVIDLGADFRLSHERYTQWYGDHPCPELIPEAAYGLSELFEDEVRNADIVANPGCYPESAILGLAPLLAERLVDEERIIIDSKSGVSGAGRTPSLATHFPEVNEGVSAYKVGEHRHKPEIEQVFSRLAGTDVSVTFTPHLIPMDRGILSTIYVGLKKGFSTGDLLGIYTDFYEGRHFVRILPEGSFPSTSCVRGSNFADIAMRADPGKDTAVIVSAIDNLVKGASGQAVQNMNIMFGLPEETGVDMAPVFP